MSERMLVTDEGEWYRVEVTQVTPALVADARGFHAWMMMEVQPLLRQGKSVTIRLVEPGKAPILSADPLCNRCGAPLRQQLMGTFICDQCRAW